MAVAGLQDDNDPAKSVEEIAEFALSMQREIAAISQRLNLPINVRVGVSTGDVVAGVIGVDKFSFDVWGAPINLVSFLTLTQCSHCKLKASILESTSVPGKIQTSRATYELLRDKYEFEERGLVELKGGNTYGL
jgi:adenylate cyclase